MSKQITIIGPAYPLRGGLSSYNELLALKLQNQGHQVKIITFSLQYPNFLFPGKTQLSNSLPPDNLDIEVSLNSINPINWILLGRKIKNEKPDLVIFRFWMPFMGPSLGTLGRMIRGNNHTKIVAITDNIIPHEKRAGDRLLTSYFLKSCDAFLTMSKSVLNDLQSFKITKPAIFNPHPMYENFGEQVDPVQAKKKLGLDVEKNYVLFFGFIRKYKGLDTLLKAFSDQRLKEKNLQLIIAGEYYDSPQVYEQLIDDLELRNHVILANHYIEDSDVSLYFSAADLVAQTYKTATQSGVTQIAYYYNRPMLVTDVGGLSELVPHQKIGYVTSQDTLEISDCIFDFYEHKRAPEFSKNIASERDKFTWESLIDNLFNVS
ncbi:MAG: glycosyltransferase, partial [Bacteroidia bacterium]|nr:glycosyltransferase [Bacteroidia bacterium]